jgi:hypothetical protein
MHLLRAQFCYFYNENKTVALSHLARAESRSPQLDEAFSIYFLRKSAHESISGGDGSTDIIACTELAFTHLFTFFSFLVHDGR